jgi:YggT family protein
MALIGRTLGLFLNILYIFLLARVLMSWFRPRYRTGGNSWFFQLEEILWRVTEPLLAPIRRLLPQTGMFDLSPLVLFLVLQVLQSLVRSIF